MMPAFRYPLSNSTTSYDVVGQEVVKLLITIPNKFFHVTAAETVKLKHFIQFINKRITHFKVEGLINEKKKKIEN